MKCDTQFLRFSRLGVISQHRTVNGNLIIWLRTLRSMCYCYWIYLIGKVIITPQYSHLHQNTTVSYMRMYDRP